MKFYDILPYILAKAFCVKIRIVELKHNIADATDIQSASIVIKQGCMVKPLWLSTYHYHSSAPTLLHAMDVYLEYLRFLGGLMQKCVHGFD